MPNQESPPTRAWAARAAESVSRAVIDTVCGVATRRALRIETEGLFHVPPSGPAILACRHYHYLYDGAALIAVLPRRVSILVALDWVRGRIARRILAAGCRTARFPTVLRDPPSRHAQPHAPVHTERAAYLRDAARAAQDLLRDGRVLAIFPEGYPTIDPFSTVKTSPDEILPFRSGFIALAAKAGRHDTLSIPIIPVGLQYQEGKPLRLTIRFGAPMYRTPEVSRQALLLQVEYQVRALSRAR